MKKVTTLISSMLMFIGVYSQQELIVNGSFEQGNQGWDFSQSDYAYTGGICTAQQGSKYLYFGTQDEQSSYIGFYDEVSQGITLPSNLHHADFIFSLSGASNEQDDQNDYDKVYVVISDQNGNEFFADSMGNTNLNVNQTIPFCETWFTSPNVIIPQQYAGQTITIAIVSSNDETYPTLFRVDNVSLKAYTTASIDENTIENITVSPNPTKGVLNLKNTSNDEMSFSLLNNVGQIMDKFSIQKGENTIDISNYKLGVYFLKNNHGKVTKIILE